ncbi:hypothetical protein K502DRAFT_364195 [Neoconidiobolus thromboides FSU 785]|nr:hypothetical protein K502DRAFT_364195 [Neoconidiobolus thromboides FSU 785]
MIEITKLIVYPIKSCAGLEIDEIELDKHGLKFDRLYTIIDENNTIIRATEYPKLYSIKPKLIEDNDHTLIKVYVKDDENNSIILDPNTNEYGDEIYLDFYEAKNIHGYKLNDKIDDWFSRNLGMKVKLIIKGDKVRPVDYVNFDKEEFKNTPTEIAFSNRYPILMLSEESVKELQDKLREENKDVNVDYRNFRPNIVIKGVNEPHKEDDFLVANVNNDIKLYFDLPCARCPFPNVNPDTGIKHTLEPSKTLSTYRRTFKNINKYRSFFGINAIPLSYGNLKIGQDINVESWSKKD